MWEFLQIRELSIKEVSKLKLQAMDKVLFAREFNVTEWLLEGYQEIAKWPQIMAFDVAERLGWETAFRLLQLREEFHIGVQKCQCVRGSPYCRYCGISMSRLLSDIDVSVESLRINFAMELTELENMSTFSSTE
jgi:hypothetical protein